MRRALAGRLLLPSLTAVLLLALALRPASARAEDPEELGVAGPPIASVTIVGRTLEKPERLARFVGLVAGAPLSPVLRARVADALTTLGYHLLGLDESPAPGGKGAVTVRLSVEPARLVRHVRVKGNWPIVRAIFNEDILRRLQQRPGSRLPPAAQVPALLEKESQRVKEYLQKEGFFDADCDVVLVPSKRPERADLDVLIYLGRWYTLGEVVPQYPRDLKTAPAVDKKKLHNVFQHTFPPLYFTRFRVDQMHEDARAAELLHHDRGYPAARVFPEFDPAVDVDHKAAKVRLRLRVNEKGHVDLHFIGNHSLTDKELTNKVTIFNAGSYDDTELAESARELHRLYQAYGHLEASVSYRKQRRGESQDFDVTFLIDEGPRLKVRSVDFAGEFGAALSFEESTLRPLVTTKVFPLIGEIGLGEGGYVTSTQLGQDADKVALYYRVRGFPHVKVRGEIARDRSAFGSVGALSADAVAAVGNGQDVHVRFYIDEGTREFIDRVSFRYVGQGQHPFTEAELLRTSDLHRTDPASREVRNSAMNRVGDLFSHHGYPYVALKPEEVWDPTHTQLHLIFHVDEGPQVRFGEILVRGNFRTADWIVRQDLPFKSGDLFDASKLAAAQRNLQKHTIFNSARVTQVPLQLPAGTNPVPVLVEIQERYDNWGGFQIDIGYATDVGATLGAGYFWGNVFGGGGQLDAKAEIAFDLFRAGGYGDVFQQFPNSSFWRLLSLSLRYIHPHLFVPQLRGEISGFVRKEFTIGLGQVTSWGARTTLLWLPSLSVRLFGRLDLTSANLQSIELIRLPSRGDSSISRVPDETRTVKLTLGGIYDNRLSMGGARNPLMPTSGWLVALQVAGSFKPLSNHSFMVFSAQTQRYQPVSRGAKEGKGISLIANLRVDWGVPIDEPSLPAVERFFAGGDASTRGYGTDQLRTEIIHGDVGPAASGSAFRVVPQGGNVRVLGTIEMQFPISTIASFPWVGALFFDVGTIFDDPQQFNVLRDVKASVGISLLRILTPVGPLSLEYAYPITQTLAEELWKKEGAISHWPGRIHFNWGIPILR